MLTEYEAWVLTQFRTKDCKPPYRSGRVAGPTVVIGLILVGTLVNAAYRRPAAIESGPGVFNMGVVVQPAISETNSVAP